MEAHGRLRGAWCVRDRAGNVEGIPAAGARAGRRRRTVRAVRAYRVKGFGKAHLEVVMEAEAVQEKRRREFSGDPDEILSVQEVSIILRIGDREITRAMDLYAQTHGDRGLAFLPGKRRKIRRRSITSWLDREEELAACR